MKKIYVGCAITGLSPVEKEIVFTMITYLKGLLRVNFEVLDFLTAVDATCSSREIYIHDIVKCVENADCVVAICDYSSTGLGYEMAVAVEKRGIPTLAMAHRGSVVSRLIEGIDRDNFHFIRYENSSAEETYAIILEVMLALGVLTLESVR